MTHGLSKRGADDASPITGDGERGCDGLEDDLGLGAKSERLARLLVLIKDSGLGTGASERALATRREDLEA